MSASFPSSGRRMLWDARFTASGCTNPGAAISLQKVNHIIIATMENHSFDSHGRGLSFSRRNALRGVSLTVNRVVFRMLEWRTVYAMERWSRRPHPQPRY